MRKNLSLSIIKELLNSKEPLKASELAASLNVSRRTLFNHIKISKELCEKNNSKLCCDRKKGYYIENPGTLRKVIKTLNLSTTFNRQESKLFVEYCLLSDNEYLHINELEEILYYSRPTIYKMLEEISEIFENHNIKLVVERKGVIIVAGEKRRRRATRAWMKKARDLILANRKQTQSDDYFKFSRCIKDLEMFDGEKIKTIFDRLSMILDLNYSKYEEQNACDFLNVLFKRVSNNHLVSMSTVVENHLNCFYETECHKVHEFILDYGFDLPKAEIVYLVANLLMFGQHLNKNYFIKDEIKHRIQNLKLKEVKDYILSVLNLNEANIEQLIDDISLIIQREFVFRVKGEFDIDSKQYQDSYEKYKIIGSLSLEIYKIIKHLFNIEYNNRTIANINFACLSAIEMNKRNIRVIVFHDCDYYEYKYLLYRLQRFPYISIVFSTDSEEEIDTFLKKEKIDLIINITDNVNDRCKYANVVTISKKFDEKDIELTLKTLEKTFQKINKDEIYIKNKKNCL